MVPFLLNLLCADDLCCSNYYTIVSGKSRISQTRGVNPIVGAPTYYLAENFQNLHEIKDIVPIWDARPGAPLESP